MSESRNVDDRAKKKRNVDEWITDIKTTLTIIKNGVVKTGSICRVPEKIREANTEKSEEWYRPKFVAVGPIHRGATIDLQTMELTKWRYMQKLLSRLPRVFDGSHIIPLDGCIHEEPKDYVINKTCDDIKGMESIIRASYGDTIHMGTEEFARNMFLDACFLLELLLRLLSENDPIPSDLGYIDDDKKISRLLTDLVLLENQVPLFLLGSLSTNLLEFENHQELASLVALSPGFDRGHDLSPEKLAESLFGCNVASGDFTNDVCHFLHLIHLCSPDPYQRQDMLSSPLQLHRCARKLRAFGISIKADPNIYYGGNVNEPGTVASALWEFMDKFEFKIQFNKMRELIIPTLHIKEATEVRWRNFIAWEQIGGLIGVGYKFTSYAYFFKGLVCSVHDVRLLKEAGVIQVHTKAKDEDLLSMLQSIVTGEERMDGRYRDLCEELNKANVKGVAGWCVLIWRMAWHYWRRFQEWLQHGLISMVRSFIRIYLGTPWKFIGVVSGLALLVLTIMQTIYAARSLLH